MTIKEELQDACDNKLVVSIVDKAIVHAIPRIPVRVYHCGRLVCFVGPLGIELKDDGRGEYWPKPCRTVAYDSIKNIDVVSASSIIWSRILWWLCWVCSRMARRYRRFRMRCNLDVFKKKKGG